MGGIIGKYFTLEQIRSKTFGDASIIPLIDMRMDEKIFTYFSSLYKLSPDIKKYMPGMDLSTPKATASFLSGHGLSTHLGLQISYVLCIEGKPAGFVFVNTPDYNKATVNFPHWSIDFCMFVPFAGNGFMSSFMPHILAMLKDAFKVDELFAIVDTHNSKCLSLLSKFWFEDWDDYSGQAFKDPNTGNIAKVLCCNLSTINFRRA
jgi:hypothetical protein